MKNWTFSLLALAICINLSAQTKYTAEDYIRMYNEAAVNNMVQHKVPASITLAQGLFESAFGNSPLANNANNHFGIKCHDWTGETYHHDDDAPQECFRKYPSAADSYADHAQFLKNRKRYVKCFSLDVCDYKGWARELKAAGYATLPTYPEKIIGIIERYKLFEYDQKALAIMGVKPQKINPEQPMEEKRPEIVQRETPKSDKKEKPSVHKEQTSERLVIQESPAIEENKAIQREVFMNNGIAYILAKRGDSQASLANELDMAEWQIRRYNDLEVNEALKDGMRIYIAPKKDHSEQIDAHVVAEGENLDEIAQFHGVKKSSIMEMNGLSVETVLVGQTLKLK